MADIKTHLRELSVATTIGLLKNGVAFTVEDLYDSGKFYSYAQSVITGSIASATNLTQQVRFTGELKRIVDNGYNLGKAIYEMPYFVINKEDTITWQGNDVKKEDPVDITVGGYGFSLKEESFILENMGLYKLLNCFTGSKYKQRHIFSDYARTEYENWFAVTWNELTRYLARNGNTWRTDNPAKGKSAVITSDGRNVTMQFTQADRVFSTSLPALCTLRQFEVNTCSQIREQVFAKFIRHHLDQNKDYNTAKKQCTEVAANALARELNDKLNYDAGLPRFLRIHEKEYYYAKTTDSGISIFKVPSKKDFGKDIVIESIEASVPDKQANILTTIRNRKTNKKLVLRNECRFSHGQFNGTPEAKMYYEGGGSLLVIYEPVDANQAAAPVAHGKKEQKPTQAPVEKVSPKTSKPAQVRMPVPKMTALQLPKAEPEKKTGEISADSLETGMTVTHITYGDGHITKIDRSCDIVHVQFPDRNRPFGIKSAFGKGQLKIK